MIGQAYRDLLLAWAFFLLFLLEAACSRKVASKPPSPPAQPGPICLQARAAMALTAVGNIDSSLGFSGQTFAGFVSRDVNDANGKTVLPSGSPATLVLAAVRNNGAHGFELGLASVTLNGNAYLVRNDGADSSFAHLGKFLGGVPGPTYGPLPKSPENNRLVISRKRIRIPDGSLITFRLAQAVCLVGSTR